jgi:hypothetical protein
LLPKFISGGSICWEQRKGAEALGEDFDKVTSFGNTILQNLDQNAFTRHDAIIGCLTNGKIKVTGFADLGYFR